MKETLATAYTPGEKDYSALVSRLKEAGIQVIYLGGYHTEAGLIIRQAKEQGMDVQLISGDALVTKEFWQIAGPAGEDTMMTFAPDLTKRPQAAGRSRGVQGRQHRSGRLHALHLCERADLGRGRAEGRHDRCEEGRAELKSGGPWQTIIGPISFDKKGDVDGPSYVFYIWKNGNYGEM